MITKEYTVKEQVAMIHKFNGNITKAAQYMGIPRKTLSGRYARYKEDYGTLELKVEQAEHKAYTDRIILKDIGSLTEVLNDGVISDLKLKQNDLKECTNFKEEYKDELKEKVVPSVKIITGIYKIVNLKNGRCYVGQSIDIHKRWSSHIYHLNSGTHHCSPLQKSWNRQNEHDFEFSILEVTTDSKKIMTEREQYWIDALHANIEDGGFNLAKASGFASYENNDLKCKNIKTLSDYRREDMLKNKKMEILKEVINILKDM